MEGERTTVLYIAGSGRSGSTLLDNILGEVDGYFSGGELRYLWERGIVENRLCGCGKHFLECSLWPSILDEAFGGVDEEFARDMISYHRGRGRARHVPNMLMARRRAAGENAANHDEYVARLSRLYRAIAKSTGANVVVDSSKLPAYGWVLDRVPSIDLRVVHLVRDPRAAGYSWMRTKVQPDRGSIGYMQSQHPMKSAMLWSMWNWATERFWATSPERYLRLRYEDLVRNPQESLRNVLRLAGHEPEEVPVLDDRTVRLGGNHTVAGNPNRLAKGTVQLSPDAEWVTKMPGWAKALVTVLTAPLLRRYGYGLWKPDASYTS